MSIFDDNIEKTLEKSQCVQCSAYAATTKGIQFYVTSCCHVLCYRCMNTNLCIVCQEKLSKDDFRPIKLNDITVEHYMLHSEKVKRIYNKSQEDFNTVQEYNNYLEDVENLIREMLINSTRQQAYEKLYNYQRINQGDIKLRRNRKDKDFEIYDEWEEKELNNRKIIEEELIKIDEEKVNLQAQYKQELFNIGENANALQNYNEALRSVNNKFSAMNNSMNKDHESLNNDEMDVMNDYMTIEEIEKLSTYALTTSNLDTINSNEILIGVIHSLLPYSKVYPKGGGYSIGILTEGLGQQ